MKNLTVIFLAFYANLLVALPILALPLPSFYQGMPYAKARAKMLELGWQVPAINSEVIGTSNEEIGGKYPEVESCSGTGLGFCRFAFTDSNGRKFMIITAGEDMKVVKWGNESAF